MNNAQDDKKKASAISIEGTPYWVIDYNGYRMLMVDGNDVSVHSEMLLSAPDALVLPIFNVLLHALPFAPRLDDILLIGLGGGCVSKFLYRNLPATRLVTVEIDPDVVGIARTYFKVPSDDERFSVVVGDGRDYIETHPQCCDVLVVDGYDNTFNVPGSLTGEEFYRACHRALRPGGVVTVNLDRRSEEWRAEHLRMLGRVFPSHLEIPVLDAQSVLLLFKDEQVDDHTVLMQRARDLEARFGVDLGLSASVERFEAQCRSAALLNDGN
jgi:spermidine synthase